MSPYTPHHGLHAINWPGGEQGSSLWEKTGKKTSKTSF